MEDFIWSTENTHCNNTETMSDYITNHLPDNFEFLFQDGSYAEIYDLKTGKKWCLHASGMGDFNNHKIRFEFIH